MTDDQTRAFVKHLWDETHDGGDYETSHTYRELEALLAIAAARRDMRSIKRYVMHIRETFSAEGVYQQADIRREQHPHGESVKFEDVEALLSGAASQDYTAAERDNELDVRDAELAAASPAVRPQEQK